MQKQKDITTTQGLFTRPVSVSIAVSIEFILCVW